MPTGGEIITIREALKKGTDMLEYVGIETPVLEAGVILSFVLGCDRAYIYSHGDRFIGESEIKRNGKGLSWVAGSELC